MNDTDLSNLEWLVIEAAVLYRRVSLSHMNEIIATPVNTYPELGMDIASRAALVEKDVIEAGHGFSSASKEFNQAVDALIAAREAMERKPDGNRT